MLMESTGLSVGVWQAQGSDGLKIFGIGFLFATFLYICIETEVLKSKWRKGVEGYLKFG